MLKDIVLKNRSYRRFYEDVPIERPVLEELVNLARNTPSTANSQALKYIIVNDRDKNAQVFETLAWAGMLKDWPGPRKGERPSAYIIILCDLSLGKNKQWDEGIAAQTIMLGAVEKGFGGCMLGAINRDKLSSYLGIDREKYNIELCLALGKPKEEVRIVEVGEDGSTAYYRDSAGVHYVPKRKLEDIIL